MKACPGEGDLLPGRVFLGKTDELVVVVVDLMAQIRDLLEMRLLVDAKTLSSLLDIPIVTHHLHLLPQINET